MMEQNKRLIIIVTIVLLLWIIPLVVMQLTNAVNWTMTDFVAATFLLLGIGLMCEFVMRKVKSSGLRITIIVCLMIVLILIWTQLAVGGLGLLIGGK